MFLPNAAPSELLKVDELMAPTLEFPMANQCAIFFFRGGFPTRVFSMDSSATLLVQ